MEIQVPSIAKGQRILAAIMITDAVGFSARMSVNEGLTLQLIDRDLKLIARTCQEFGGTVLKSTGDGLLIYFLSAVEAVSCGLDIQRRLTELADGLPTENYLDHRIGIHLGDILVSQQDVMGNGVNITARLQTYAKPRGLCVSQMIFDVVKARLNLHATFLGPLKLKNIQETVPAYQLALQADPESMEGPQISDEPTCTLPMSTEALLTVAVKNLLTDPNSQRIKKLVFAAYQQTWENDTAVLEQFGLRDLLENLRERYPSLDALEQQFQRIVMGLNRQTHYAQVASTILKQLQTWYSRSLTEAVETKVDTPAQSTSVPQQPCHDVVQQLQQASDSIRIRKLLYCLVHNRWQNDVEVLQTLDLMNLVQDTLKTAPRRQDLQYHLQRIIKHLNRKGEYTRLANEVMGAFHNLYELENDDSSLREPSNGVAEVPQSGQTLVTCLSPVSPADNEFTTLHDALSAPESWSDDESSDPPDASVPRSLSSLFDLRMEIFQYTNPLRAKILLYSCLHGPFCYTDEAWSALRRQSLDELLRQVFEYCPTYADLDSKLTIIAHCLDQPDESSRAAGIIARAMKTYYPADPRMPLQAAPCAAPSPKAQRNPQTSANSRPAKPSVPAHPVRHSALSPA
jgi:adenylate cyclase